MQQSKPVMGLRIDANQRTPQMIQPNQSFEKCPIAHAAGIPLYVKRLLNQPRIKGKRYAICRMMTEPSVGIAPIEWQYGGSLQPAPPVLVARKDGVSFNANDWAVLDDFQMAMLDDGPRKVTRKDFVSFVKKNCQQNTSNIVLEVLYPKGGKCEIHGFVSNVELNGKYGICNGVYGQQRLQVEIPELQKEVSIRSRNVRMI